MNTLFAKSYLLSIYVLTCVRTELMDDLVNVMVHNDQTTQQYQTNHELANQPPLNIPWHARKDEENKSLVKDVKKTLNAPRNTPHGHPGYRGGKKRELVIKSIIERLLDGNGQHNDLDSRSSQDESQGMKVTSQQQEKLDALLRSVTADTKRISSVKQQVFDNRREMEADTLVASLLARNSGGGYDGPQNLPWKKRDEEIINTPNLPWKRSKSAPNLPWKRNSLAPNLPWKRSESAPNLPWKRSESAPNLPWKRSESASNLPWKRSESAPNLPWKRSESAPNLPWKRSERSPNLPWKRSESAPNLRWKRSKGAPNLPWKRSKSAPNLPWRRSLNVGAQNLQWARRTADDNNNDAPNLPWSRKKDMLRIKESMGRIEKYENEKNHLYKRLVSDLEELLKERTIQ